MIKAGIITLSDKGYRGEREDLSGKVIENILREAEISVEEYVLLPDDEEMLANKLIEFSDVKKYQLILTTGGTGLTFRDITPQATLKVIEREVPGLAEGMRMNSLKFTPKAMLSRAVAGTRGKSLIVNLPGSPKGVEECLNFILPVIPHGIELLEGNSGDCARP
jgi:molybdenum cofactor synthesis domain-containing protein